MTPSFNTVVLYDLENLLKGYDFSARLMANLSLEAVLKRVEATGITGRIAHQRAYANWADPRLGYLRQEISEMGVEPVQVFGFGREAKKNVADIQLAVDAVDLAHQRPNIEVFVIVSGDGGYASLARKLHEHGKEVIGAAYPMATNRLFSSVCDAFVWIPDPETDQDTDAPAERAGREADANRREVSAPPMDPRVLRSVSGLGGLKGTGPKEMIAKARQVLDRLARYGETARDLHDGGMHLAVAREALTTVIPGFDPMNLGFPKFLDSLRLLCATTPLCTARMPDQSAMLAFRNDLPPGAQVLPDLEPHDAHSPENYRSILQTGAPMIKLPSRRELALTAAWLETACAPSSDLGSLLAKAADELSGEVPVHGVKLAVLACIGAGLFSREPDGIPIAEQTLSLRRPPEGKPGWIVSALAQAARDKIVEKVGRADENAMAELFLI